MLLFAFRDFKKCQKTLQWNHHSMLRTSAWRKLAFLPLFPATCNRWQGRKDRYVWKQAWAVMSGGCCRGAMFRHQQSALKTNEARVCTKANVLVSIELRFAVYPNKSQARRHVHPRKHYNFGNSQFKSSALRTETVLTQPVTIHFH